MLGVMLSCLWMKNVHFRHVFWGRLWIVRFVFLLGWRPSFKWYNQWFALWGTIACLGTMFGLGWQYGLALMAITTMIYTFVHYRKLDDNFGSSRDAAVYKGALQQTLQLSQINDHVKNYR